MKREFYILTVEFDNTIAAGGSAESYTQVDTSGRFIAESMVVTAWIPTAQTALINTPVYDSSSSIVGNNTFVGLAQTRFQINIAGVNWFSNPVRGSVFGAGGGNPFYFQTKPVLDNNAQLVCTMYNDSGTFTLQAQIALMGYKETK